MKRRDIMKAIANHAKASGLPMTQAEGANHTKVKVGNKTTTVPRHTEVNEITARKILEQIGVTK